MSGSHPIHNTNVPLKNIDMRRIGFVFSFLLVLAVVVAPFCWLVLCSLKPKAELFNVGFTPNTLTIVNYVSLFTRTEITQFLWNSTLIAAAVTGVTALFATLGAY